MILAQLTPKAAGIGLFGDELDLHSLEGTIEKLYSQAEQSDVMPRQTLEYATSLISGWHQGFEQLAELTRIEIGDLEVQYAGVHVALPAILWQVAVLRQLASFSILDSGDQANLFRLRLRLRSRCASTTKHS